MHPRSHLSALLFVVAAAATGRSTDLPVVPGQSIQSVIQIAQNGDRLLVQPGVYFEAITFAGKNIEIVAVAGAKFTTIDAAGLGFPAVRIDGGATQAILDGFTVTHGAGTTGGGIAINGGAGTIRDCVVRQNSAAFGGGIAVTTQVALTSGIGASIERCTIEDNVSSARGGGLYVASGNAADIRNCEFRGNSATGDGGGGLALDNSSNTLRGCFIHHNQAATNGGGIDVLGRNTKVLGCRIEENSAAEGGGIAVAISGSFVPVQFFVESTILWRNHALVRAGGIRFSASGLFGPHLFATQCSIVGNQAPIASALAIVNGYGSLRNLVVWDHVGLAIDAPAPTTITDSDIAGGFPGAGNSNVDPLFVDLLGGDLHLRANSPCVDSGSAPGPQWIATDFEGDPIVGAPDRGADQFFRHLYVVGEQLPGATLYLKCIGAPGDAVILFASPALAAVPLPVPGFGAFQLAFPLFPTFPVALPNIPFDGSLSIPIAIPTPWTPVEVALQTVIGPQLSNAIVVAE